MNKCYFATSRGGKECDTSRGLRTVPKLNFWRKGSIIRGFGLIDVNEYFTTSNVHNGQAKNFN